MSGVDLGQIYINSIPNKTQAQLENDIDQFRNHIIVLNQQINLMPKNDKDLKKIRDEKTDYQRRVLAIKTRLNILQKNAGQIDTFNAPKHHSRQIKRSKIKLQRDLVKEQNKSPRDEFKIQNLTNEIAGLVKQIKAIEIYLRNEPTTPVPVSKQTTAQDYDPQPYIDSIPTIPEQTLHTDHASKRIAHTRAGNRLSKELRKSPRDDVMITNLDSELKGLVKEMNAIDKFLQNKQNTSAPPAPRTPLLNQMRAKKARARKPPAKKAKAKGSGSTRTTKSSKAGLQFPVSRIKRYLKKARYGKRVGIGAGVYLAAVLEYLSAEILELSGNAARDKKKKTINPRHIQLAIRNDEELNKLLDKVTIAQGGVLPNIHTVLLPKK